MSCHHALKRAVFGATILASCGALAFAAGCSRRSTAPDLARVDQEAIEAAKQPVNILDHDLRNKIAGDLADATRLPDGRLAVRVNLRNSTRNPQTVELRSVFKDPSGMSTGDETAWKTIFFSPQQAQTYRVVSREPGAELFSVEVRKP